jgi:hypothetical protein
MKMGRVTKSHRCHHCRNLFPADEMELDFFLRGRPQYLCQECLEDEQGEGENRGYDDEPGDRPSIHSE